MIGSGETLGPMIGSVLTKNFGFRYSCNVMAIGVLVYAGIYFISTVLYDKMRTNTKGGR